MTITRSVNTGAIRPPPRGRVPSVHLREAFRVAQYHVSAVPAQVRFLDSLKTGQNKPVLIFRCGHGYRDLVAVDAAQIRRHWCTRQRRSRLLRAARGPSRMAGAHSGSYRSDTPICTRTRWRTWSRTRSKRRTPARTCSSAGVGSWTIGRTTSVGSDRRARRRPRIVVAMLATLHGRRRAWLGRKPRPSMQTARRGADLSSRTREGGLPRYGVRHRRRGPAIRVAGLTLRR